MANKMMEYALLIGSNEGDSISLLRRARILFSLKVGTITRLSSIYRTSPWGETEQRDFVNQAIVLQSTLEPLFLLQALQDIERIIGKTKTSKWGPRNIDIDILLADKLVIDTKELQVPHPHMTHRNFVLIPLAEIAGELIHPLTMRTIDQLREDCPDDGTAVKV